MASNDITVRLVGKDERGSVAPLLEELLQHYAMAAPAGEDFAARLREQPAGVEMLVAFIDAAPAGFASFAQIFPGVGTAPQLYMKELYVASARRGARIGEALMRELARIARGRGCVRLDWTTAKDNTGARAFYERIGAQVVEHKVYYRLDEAGLAALAGAPPVDV